MSKDTLSNKIIALTVILLFLYASVVPSIGGIIRESNSVNDYLASQVLGSTTDKSVLDIRFIYNITENLSNIIFDVYDEENGEIAKGRAFGTKGEHKAAEMLCENMTALGLDAHLEPIQNLPLRPRIANKIEVQEYELTIHNDTTSETVDCFPAFALIGPRHKPLQRDCTFNFSGLKVRREHPPIFEDTEDYVLMPQTDSKFKLIDLIKNDLLKYYINCGITALKDLKDYFVHPHCRAKIYFDSNNDTHDILSNQKFIPRFFINGSIGNKINASIEDFTIDFYLKQRFNKSVISYNVIGQLNGSDPTKTVIVACLYDSWWCQGTADSAIGMAIVMGIAKYFHDHEIKPKYTTKFIGFCGEEYGMRGSKYYEAAHPFENIIYVIDLNQLGFKQDEPRLTLQIAANNQEFLDEVWEVVQRSNYVNRTGNITDIEPILMPLGHLSDDHPFATKRPFRCKTVCFLKNGKWLLHHRDGLNHSEGDVLKYFDPIDVRVTGEIILNVTKHLTVDDPYDRFLDCCYSTVDFDDNAFHIVTTRKTGLVKFC